MGSVEISADQLKRVYPAATGKSIADFVAPLNATIAEFDISTPVRQAIFLAQVGHESGQLRYVRELASGAAYEGRADLGNTQPGDGARYKGRGLIQITGRANYTALMLALDIDCIEHPEVVEEPVNACRSAGWFWDSRKLNAMADAGNFLGITRRINGGTNGLADRQALWARAREVL